MHDEFLNPWKCNTFHDIGANESSCLERSFALDERANELTGASSVALLFGKSYVF